MSKKLMLVEVRGRNFTWCFMTEGDPKYLPEWRADGVEIALVENTVPVWVAELGLVRPWCFLQDVFNLRNPFRG